MGDERLRSLTAWSLGLGVAAYLLWPLAYVPGMNFFLVWPLMGGAAAMLGVVAACLAGRALTLARSANARRSRAALGMATGVTAIVMTVWLWVDRGVLGWGDHDAPIAVVVAVLVVLPIVVWAIFGIRYGASQPAIRR